MGAFRQEAQGWREYFCLIARRSWTTKTTNYTRVCDTNVYFCIRHWSIKIATPRSLRLDEQVTSARAYNPLARIALNYWSIVLRDLLVLSGEVPVCRDIAERRRRRGTRARSLRATTTSSPTSSSSEPAEAEKKVSRRRRDVGTFRPVLHRCLSLSLSSYSSSLPRSRPVTSSIFPLNKTRARARCRREEDVTPKSFLEKRRMESVYAQLWENVIP